jgi:hypothetical protein
VRSIDIGNTSSGSISPKVVGIKYKFPRKVMGFISIYLIAKIVFLEETSINLFLGV